MACSAHVGTHAGECERVDRCEGLCAPSLQTFAIDQYTTICAAATAARPRSAPWCWMDAAELATSTPVYMLGSELSGHEELLRKPPDLYVQVARRLAPVRATVALDSVPRRAHEQQRGPRAVTCRSVAFVTPINQ